MSTSIIIPRSRAATARWRDRGSLATVVLVMTVALTGGWSSAALAADATITGRVADARTGASLEGAQVVVRELGLRESTSSSGEYRFRAVPEGSYTVEVQYYGLGGDSRNVTLTGGEVEELSFALGGGEDAGIEEVVVYGERISEGQARAINQQRAAKAIETIISEELFGQVNDGNIGNAMQRMPGLSVDTDGFSEIPRYVNIRGISTAYNAVQVDGTRLPATGTGRGEDYGDTGRGFALDDIPADAITTIEIVKAPTPDMDGDGLGGTVNLRTKSAFDYGDRRVEYRLGGNYTALRDETHPTGTGTFMDVFELSGGRRLGVAITGSYYETNEGFDNRDLDYFPLRAESPINQGIATAPISSGGVDPQPVSPGSPIATQGPGLAAVLAATDAERFFVSGARGPREAISYHEDTEYNNFIIERKRSGFAGNFDLEWNDRTRLYLHTLYHQEDKDYDDYRYHKIMDNDHGDGCGETFDPASPQACFLSRRIVPGDQPGPAVRLGADPTRRTTIDFVDDNLGRATLDANGDPRGQVRYNNATHDFDIELWSVSVGGKFEFEQATLDVAANYSRADKLEDENDGTFSRDGFAFEYDHRHRFTANDAAYRVINGEYSYLPDRDPFELIVDEAAVDTITPEFFEIKRRDVTEDRWSLSADYERNLSGFEYVDVAWKVGAKLASMERDFDYTETQYDLAEPGDDAYLSVPWAELVKENPYGPVDAQQMPFAPDSRALARFVADPANQAAGLFSIDTESSLLESTQQDYKADETTAAVYAMATLQSGPLEVIGGARLEYTDFQTTRLVIGEDEDGFDLSDVSSETEGRDYYNLLPSLIVNFSITDNLLLRAALTETFSRPQVADLVAVRQVNPNDDPVEIEEGNPNLPALESNNIDLVLEFYPTDGLYSVGLFRKDMTGFSFEATTIIQSDPRFDGKEVRISTPLATGKARNQGVELQAFQRLSFLPQPFDGLFVNGNYTFTDSSAEYPNRENENELPTRGASKHLFFASLGYEWRRVSAEIQYRFRSPYIEGLAFVDQQGENTFLEDDQFGELETWNANLSWQLSESVSLYANVTNLFNEINASRQGYRDNPEDIYFNERRFAFGVRGSF